MDHIKDPNKVKAGKARQQKLRDQLGSAGYAAYQKARYADTLKAHPDFPARGAAAANAAQLAAWGPEGYLAQRQAAFRACRAKHGPDVACRIIAQVHEQRRLHRLSHPTQGEQALRDLLVDLGFRVLLLQEPFDYCAWCRDPLGGQLSPHDAIPEGGVGPYYCDVLLPMRSIAIEVEGGIHQLTRARDERRRAFLVHQGLTILVMSNEQVLDTPRARQHIRQVLGC